MPRYTRCPYYIDDSRKTISCEDVCRSFDSMDRKWKWMDMYCDSWDWMRCPFAADRSDAYRRAEEGETEALDEQKEKAMKSEIKSLTTKLGRLTKKVERMQKKIDELRAVNQSFVNRNDTLYRKWRDADEKVRKTDDRIWSEIGYLSGIYEQRMCYLIDAFAPGQIVYEDDIEAWAKDREFALLHEYIDVNDPDKRRTGLIWKVVFNEEGEEDGHEDTDIQEQEQE